MHRIPLRAVLLAMAPLLAFALPGQDGGAAKSARSDLPITTSLTRIFAGGEPETLAEFNELETYVQALYAKVLPCTVNIGGGTGVLLADGFVLTAGHVTAPRQTFRGIRNRGRRGRGRGRDPERERDQQKKSRAGRPFGVILPDGRRLKAKTLGVNRYHDSGLLRLDESDATKNGLPHLEMGHSTRLKPGQWCVMLGYPGGRKVGLSPPLRLGRILRVVSPGRGFLVSDCTMSAGDSGGPLFDMQGRVIGINSRISRNLMDNMHVPIDAFREQWKSLVAGEVKNERRGKPPVPGWLGVVGDLQAEVRGAKVQRVLEDSPAEAAGIQVGDIIVRLGQRRIRSARTLTRQVRKLWPGDRVDVTLLRGGEELELPAAAVPLPGAKPKPSTKKPAAKKEAVR